MAIIVKNKDGQDFTVAGAGKDGANGKSAYQIAVDNGYTGTEAEWLASLKGQDGADGADGVGVPPGGTTGQILKKATDDDFNTQWADNTVDLAGNNVTGVLPVTKGGTGGTIWPINPNILRNADFRKPVNRNGQSEYTAAGYTIDRWEGTVTVTLQNGYLTISSTTSHNAFAAFTQTIDGKQFNSKTVTVSVLYRNTSQEQGEITIYNTTQNVWKASAFLPVSSDWNLVKLTKTFNNTDFGNNDFLDVNLLPSLAGQQLAGSIDIKAVKLELGNQQTLAHQDADGNWVLNNPLNYDLQYALCSQYSPITGEFVGSQHSNPNLLDNARWDNKDCIINQRNQNQYSIGYGIDRWAVLFSSNAEACSVTLNDNNITLSLPISTHFRQYTELKYEASKYVFSILTSDGKLYSTMGTTYYDSLVLYIANTTNVGTLNVGLYVRNPDGLTISLVAAKLELGPVQTLAHKEGDIWVLNDPPPNKALELAKCQRYFRVLNPSVFTVPVASSASNNRLVVVPIPGQPMRVVPAVTLQNWSTNNVLYKDGKVAGRISSNNAQGISTNLIALESDTEISTGNIYALHLNNQIWLSAEL